MSKTPHAIKVLIIIIIGLLVVLLVSLFSTWWGISQELGKEIRDKQMLMQQITSEWGW